MDGEETLKQQVIDTIFDQQDRLDSATLGLDDLVRCTIFRRAFRCSLAPVEQGRIEVHLLFLLCALTPDELPNMQEMEFQVLDLSWLASQNTEVIRKITKQKSDGTKSDITQIIVKRDPQAKKNFHKWIKKIRKEIQKDVRNYIRSGKHVALKTNPRDLWEVLIYRSGLYSVGTNQKTVIQTLRVNWQGQIINKGAERHPLVYDLRKLCQEFSRYLLIQQVREEFLWQAIPQKEKVNLQHQPLNPWHIGWYDIYGTMVMSGICFEDMTPNYYGSALLRIPPERTGSLEELLSVAPYEVTVSLLCYGIFSVIKPFIPDYPARISVKDSFSSVIQKQKKMIFLSLMGPNSETLAELFFGAFTDYGEGDDDEKATGKRLREIQNRVHDGIIILNREYKNLQTFRNGAMLQDACVVLTNSSFEENDFEIRLSSDQFDPKLYTPAMKRVFPNILAEFLQWFQVEYICKQSEKAKEAHSKIADRAEALYRKWFHNPYAEKPTKVVAEIKELRNYKVGTWSELNAVIKLYIDRLTAAVEENWEGRYYEMRRAAAITRIANFSKAARQIAKCSRAEKEDSVVNEFFNLKRIKKQYPLKKTANLHMALFVFQRFMQEHPVYSPIVLPRPWEDYLAPKGKVKQKNVRRFATFLSQKIEAGQIIPFRGEPTANCSGWYDGKKNLIYLPYPSYYADFRKWLSAEKQVDIPSQRSLQQELADNSLLLLADNHSKGGYQRADYRIMVAPSSDPQAKPSSVIKVKPDLVQLTAAAQNTLQRLAEQKVSRRRKSPKG